MSGDVLVVRRRRRREAGEESTRCHQSLLPVSR